MRLLRFLGFPFALWAWLTLSSAPAASVIVINGPMVPSVGAPPTYLVTQDFETNYSGPPPGWTSDAGAPDYHNTSSPLVGTANFEINNNNQTASVSFTAQNDVWLFCAFNPRGSAFSTPIVLSDGTSDLLLIGVWGSANYRITGGGNDNFPSATVSSTQTLYIWAHYTKGSGSNSSVAVYISTTTTIPGSPTTSWTNGTATTQAAKFIYRDGGGGAGALDYVRISTSSIGSAPP